MIGLSRRENDLLGFIRSHVKEQGVSPSFEQMAVHLGLSPNSKSSVQRSVDRLVWAGCLAKTAGDARSLKPVYTADYHAPDCDCGDCLRANYLRDLKLVEALQVAPPAALVPKLRGLKPVPALTRVYWRSGFPKSLRPKFRKAQSQCAPAQAG